MAREQLPRYNTNPLAIEAERPQETPEIAMVVTLGSGEIVDAFAQRFRIPNAFSGPKVVSEIEETFIRRGNIGNPIVDGDLVRTINEIGRAVYDDDRPDPIDEFAPDVVADLQDNDYIPESWMDGVRDGSLEESADANSETFPNGAEVEKSEPTRFSPILGDEVVLQPFSEAAQPSVSFDAFVEEELAQADQLTTNLEEVTDLGTEHEALYNQAEVASRRILVSLVETDNTLAEAVKTTSLNEISADPTHRFEADAGEIGRLLVEYQAGLDVSFEQAPAQQLVIGLS